MRKSTRLVDKDLNRRIRERDNYTCQMCLKKKRPIQIEIHHIQRWVDAPELRYSMSNLICLCKKCHKSIKGRESYYQLYFTEILYNRLKAKPNAKRSNKPRANKRVRRRSE